MTWEEEKPEVASKMLEMFGEGWWRSQPGLWMEVTKGYGKGWWDKSLKQINAIEDDRASNGLCVFCAKPLAAQEEMVVVEPPRPWVGPFCTEGCANAQFYFYCIREGK